MERTQGRWRFVGPAPVKHVLWGWLQIGEIHAVDDLPPDALPWARYHPHFHGNRDSNTLYIAADRLRLIGDDLEAPGAGVFRRLEDGLVLTDPDVGSLTRWRLPPAFYPDSGKPPLTYHGNLARWWRGDRYCTLQSLPRGQEFVLDTPGIQA